MKERLPSREPQPLVEVRRTEEENLLKQAAKTQAGRWLAASMLALSLEAAAPSEAQAQDPFRWYYETFETEFSAGIDPTGGGMGTMTIRERSADSRRRIGLDLDPSIVFGIEPDPMDTRYLRSGFSDEELDAIDERARLDREAHPEDYEGVEGRLPAELPVSTDLIQHGPWETELLPEHVYLDEDGSRYGVVSVPDDANDAEVDALVARFRTRLFSGRTRLVGSRSIVLPDGSHFTRNLFEAPAVIDTARLEGNWYSDLRPGHIYADDHERMYVVVENRVAPGRALSGYRDEVIAAARAALGRDVVIVDERRLEQPPLSTIPSIARYLVAERLVDIHGDPIDLE